MTYDRTTQVAIYVEVDGEIVYTTQGVIYVEVDGEVVYTTQATMYVEVNEYFPPQTQPRSFGTIF